MGDLFGDYKITLPDFSLVAPRDATYVRTDFITQAQAEILADSINRRKQEVEQSKKEEAAIRQKYETVSNMIKNDKAAPKNLDVDKMTDMIMNAANETGVDPIIIASIAKQETHYNQNVPTGNGSGIMQLTSISIKDMYQRPNVYDPQMKQLMKKYGSLEKIFAAKKKDPSLNLGNFGEMLYKYGDWEKLRNAMRKDSQLNITLGAYLFKAKLNAADGDVHKALVNYNGSSRKLAYAKSVMGFIDEVNAQQKKSINSVA